MDLTPPLPPRTPIHLDPGLLDALVQAVRARPSMVAGEDAVAAHATAVEHVYRRTAGDERRHALDRVNARLVQPLGLADRFCDLLAQSTGLAGRIGRAVLAVAPAGEQRVDLHGPDEAGSLTLVARLTLDVWLAPASSERVLRHELMHVCDMLDPGFAYLESAAWPGRTHGQRQLARERFTALWCASVDARLERSGRDRLETAPAYRARIAQLFALVPEQFPGELSALADGARPPHDALLAICAGASRLTGAGSPGGPCPLCGFPSTDWAGERDTPELVTRFITREFPGWTAANGCCRRCLEGYESRIDQGGSR